MLFLKSDEPSRWQRASRTARDAGSTATEAVRSAAAGKPRVLRLLVVPVAVGAVVWFVRAMRTRSAAGEEATAEATEGKEQGASPSSDGRKRRDLQPSGNRATS
jgi:uncharacterized protein HemX